MPPFLVQPAILQTRRTLRPERIYAPFPLKKVKIAFFAEILIEDFDGASRTMFQLIHRIPAARFEFLFFCGMGPERIAGCEAVRIPAVSLIVNRPYKMAVPWFSRRRMRRKLRAFQPDVIHIATPSMLGEFALRYANQQHIPVLTIYHTHFTSYVAYYLKSSPRLADFVRARVMATQKSFYNRCDRVYIPSEEMRSELTSYGVEPTRLQLWQRGMDTTLFSPAKKDRAQMQELTGNDWPVVLFASRLVWEKNLETLCRIYQVLQEAQIPHNFLIAGDGVALEECQRRMPRAIFTGKVDHQRLSMLYASSEVFVFPSISESYGNVVVEAMASGLPCVIADGGGSRNFIEQGLNGFLCAPNEPTDYVRRIQQLLEDKNLHRQLVEAGLKYSKSLRWEDLAATYFHDLEVMAARAPVTNQPG